MEMTEKKTYETPEAEKMVFNYRDQVVAASSCIGEYKFTGEDGCDEQIFVKPLN